MENQNRYSLADSPGPFEVKGDVVYDPTTGLTWQRQDDGKKRKHEGAVRYSESLQLGGRNDWRLPTRRELYSIVDFARHSPAFAAEFFKLTFAATTEETLWSAEVDEMLYLHKTPRTEIQWWQVEMQFGGNPWIFYQDSAISLCVAGSPVPAARFKATSQGTVVDETNGLEWQQQDDGKKRNWEEAQAYAHSLNLAEGGWRLPGVKELESLVDLSKKQGPPINESLFPQTKEWAYWSATPGASSSRRRRTRSRAARRSARRRRPR